ncbi:MAG: hypothetical protein Tsb0015_13610 [Simkaniaceae bacterium]
MRTPSWFFYTNRFESWSLKASAAPELESVSIAQLIQVELLRQRKRWFKFRVHPYQTPNFRIGLCIESDAAGQKI